MRVGIVGTNFISDMFMAAAKPFEEIQVTAVTSGHRENAEVFAQKYNIPKVFDSFEGMLKDSDCELIYLGVPNSLHVPMALQCVEAGIPVFVEKPFAVNVEEGNRLFDLAKEKKVYVHDGIVPLYTKNFEILKNSLPMVGRIRRAVFSFGKYSSRYRAYLNGENPTTFQMKFANGSLMDLGVYCIADLVALFGKPESVYAHAVKLETGVDGAAEAILHYDGFDGVVMTSKISNSEIISEIEGEEGTLVIEQPGSIFKIWFHSLKTKETTLLSEDTDSPFGFQIQDLLENLKAGNFESRKVPHSLSEDILTVLEDCRKSAGIFYPMDQQ